LGIICEDRPDCAHCRFEPLRNVPIDRLQRPGAGRSGIKLGGKPRTVGGECVQLAG
jgi:hypothetical protein